MIRVLHVLPWITGGGVERRRASIAEQSTQEFQHAFFTFQSKGELAERIRDAGAAITDGRDNALVSHRAFIDLARVVREYKPHIIHGAVFEGVILAATVGRLLRVPVIIGEETSDATNRSPRGHALFKALSMLTHRTVAISPQVAEKLEKTTGVAPNKIHLIMNGVDPLKEPTLAMRTTARAQFNLPENAYVLGTMARLVDDSHKRTSDILRAMPQIAEKIPNAHLLICGSGKEREKLEKLAQNLGVQNHVTFAGTVIPQDGFSAMDVFVHVAQREGFGLAVAEAAFCALPIITTGVGGIASIVLPDQSARIVPVGDPRAIAQAANEFYNHPELRERFGQKGREYAVVRFSSERYVRDVEALYRMLLKERKVRV